MQSVFAVRLCVAFPCASLHFQNAHTGRDRPVRLAGGSIGAQAAIGGKLQTLKKEPLTQFPASSHSSLQVPPSRIQNCASLQPRPHFNSARKHVSTVYMYKSIIASPLRSLFGTMAEENVSPARAFRNALLSIAFDCANGLTVRARRAKLHCLHICASSAERQTTQCTCRSLSFARPPTLALQSRLSAPPVHHPPAFSPHTAPAVHRHSIHTCIQCDPDAAFVACMSRRLCALLTPISPAHNESRLFAIPPRHPRSGATSVDNVIKATSLPAVAHVKCFAA